MSKKENKNTVEAQASDTIYINPGDRLVDGDKMNFLSGYAFIHARNDSSDGAVMGVHIMETTYWDEPVEEWFLDPGEYVYIPKLAVPKDTLYLRLSSYSIDAKGFGTLTTV